MSYIFPNYLLIVFFPVFSFQEVNVVFNVKAGFMQVFFSSREEASR